MQDNYEEGNIIVQIISRCSLNGHVDITPELYRDVEDLVKEYAAKHLGMQGGKKTASLYGKEHFSKIAKGWPKGKKRKVKPNQ